MHLVDILVIAAYLLTLVAIGVRVSRRQTTTDAYFVAGRSVPGWAAGFSLLATIITSVTFIAYPGAAYEGDWTLLVPGIMFVAVIAAIGPVVVPFFRQAVSMSVYEYFGKRFGPWVRMYASFAFATGHFAKMGFVFYLLALSVSGITGCHIAPLLIGLGAITVFYTFIGGLKAVIWTDVVQGFLLWTGVAVTIVLLLFSSHASPGAMLHLIAANHKTSLGSFNFDLSKPTFWTMAIYGLFFYLQKYTADQTVVQRYLAAKTDRSALRGISMGAWLCLPIWTAFMLIGSLLWAFYRLTNQALPAAITRSDQVFPYYMVTQMPVGVGGLFLAALFGAAMSMLASDLNCLGLILVEDFYSHFFPHHTDVQRLRFGKLSIILCGALAIATALRLSSTQASALALYYTVTAIVAGGLAGLFLLAFLSQRAGRTAAVVGIAANLLFTAYATLTVNGGKILNLHAYNFPWNEYTIGAIGNLLLLTAGLLTAALSPADFNRSPRNTLWDWLAARRRSRIHVMQ
ncbi:MAG: sodium:solute symporter [Terracidiphilus sp.]|jgi:SSS family solute:Na+ symporter